MLSLIVFSFDTQAVKRVFRTLMKESDDKYCKVMSVAISKFLKAFDSWPISGKRRDNDSEDESGDTPSSKRARHSTGSQAEKMDGAFAHHKLVIPDDDEMLSEDL